MPSTLITGLHAREVLDSRGNPTVAVRASTSDHIQAEAYVPSGASTGSHEALELRDGDTHRYHGKGVLKAVRNVNSILRKKIVGMDGRNQQKIDQLMIDLDGTLNKSKLGANAILGTSLAVAQVTARTLHQPLYAHIRSIAPRKYTGWKMPGLMMNIVNGGKHADSGFTIQEFMIVPQARRLAQRVRMGSEVFHTLQAVLRKMGAETGVGDEGGFAPHLKKNAAALDVMSQAVQLAGYRLGKDICFALDPAASEFHSKGVYRFDEKKLSGYQLIQVYVRWIKKYPLISIEDGLAEDDWNNWRLMTHELGKKIQIVGDDLFVTNLGRLNIGIDRAVANSILIKFNQVGSLTETLHTIARAQEAGYTVVVSHRSGETEDTTLADLAVAVNAEYVKTGSLSRSERVAKYNRLMAIEEEIRG